MIFVVSFLISISIRLKRYLIGINQKNGASRTDTGVHTLGQCATFNFSSKIPVDKLPTAINAKLPSDIVVHDAKYVNETFHPQYDAKKKNLPICNPNRKISKFHAKKLQRVCTRIVRYDDYE